MEGLEGMEELDCNTKKHGDLSAYSLKVFIMIAMRQDHI